MPYNSPLQKRLHHLLRPQPTSVHLPHQVRGRHLGNGEFLGSKQPRLAGKVDDIFLGLRGEFMAGNEVLSGDGVGEDILTFAGLELPRFHGEGKMVWRGDAQFILPIWQSESEWPGDPRIGNGSVPY